MVAYHHQQYNQQQAQTTLPYLLLGIFCVLLVLVIRFGWEYLMWLWNSRLPPSLGRRDPPRSFSSPRSGASQRRKVLKKPVEYYEEPEDEYDDDFDQENN
jgi:hypothetical protein